MITNVKCCKCNKLINSKNYDSGLFFQCTNNKCKACLQIKENIWFDITLITPLGIVIILCIQYLFGFWGSVIFVIFVIIMILGISKKTIEMPKKYCNNKNEVNPIKRTPR